MLFIGGFLFVLQMHGNKLSARVFGQIFDSSYLNIGPFTPFFNFPSFWHGALKWDDFVCSNEGEIRWGNQEISPVFALFPWKIAGQHLEFAVCRRVFHSNYDSWHISIEIPCILCVGGSVHVNNYFRMFLLLWTLWGASCHWAHHQQQRQTTPPNDIIQRNYVITHFHPLLMLPHTFYLIELQT